METCITCGMPLKGEHANDIGIQTPDGPVCKFDSEDGKIKDPQAIFDGGVNFFLGPIAGGDRDLAERLVRKNMKALPYWQQHPFDALNGQEATDEEFATAMAKL